jgi:hypothetical protein
MEQLSLLEQSRLDDPRASDEDHVVLLADRLVAEVGLPVPLDIAVVASVQGIKRVEVVSQPWAGCLTASKEGLIIRLRDTDPRVRQRFSGFHEISHTFLPGFALAPQFRCDSGEDDRRTAEEHLCDVGASELLFPRRFFQPDLDESPFGLSSIEDLAEKYQGSLEATARRSVDLSRYDSLMVVFEVGLKPTESSCPNPQPRLRVRYSHGKGNWPFIPRHKSAGERSIANLSLEGESCEGRSRLDGLVRGFENAVEVSALSCPYFDNRGIRHQRVVALYRRTKEE